MPPPLLKTEQQEKSQSILGSFFGKTKPSNNTLLANTVTKSDSTDTITFLSKDSFHLSLNSGSTNGTSVSQFTAANREFVVNVVKPAPLFLQRSPNAKFSRHQRQFSEQDRLLQSNTSNNDLTHYRSSIVEKTSAEYQRSIVASSSTALAMTSPQLPRLRVPNRLPPLSQEPVPKTLPYQYDTRRFGQLIRALEAGNEIEKAPRNEPQAPGLFGGPRPALESLQRRQRNTAVEAVQGTISTVPAPRGRRGQTSRTKSESKESRSQSVGKKKMRKSKIVETRALIESNSGEKDGYESDTEGDEDEQDIILNKIFQKQENDIKELTMSMGSVSLVGAMNALESSGSDSISEDDSEVQVEIEEDEDSQDDSDEQSDDADSDGDGRPPPPKSTIQFTPKPGFIYLAAYSQNPISNYHVVCQRAHILADSNQLNHLLLHSPTMPRIRDDNETLVDVTKIESRKKGKRTLVKHDLDEYAEFPFTKPFNDADFVNTRRPLTPITREIQNVQLLEAMTVLYEKEQRKTYRQQHPKHFISLVTPKTFRFLRRPTLLGFHIRRFSKKRVRSLFPIQLPTEWRTMFRLTARVRRKRGKRRARRQVVRSYGVVSSSHKSAFDSVMQSAS